MVRAWQLGAGPGTDPVVIDLDSTICEVHGKAKQGAAYGYTKRLGYHPLLATLAGTGEILFARMRKGSAGSSRGVVRFVDELVARLKRAGATGAKTVRADSGFWSWKLIDRLSHHNIAWSITVTNHASIRKAIRQIPDNAWRSIDYTIGSHAQVAETTYVTGGYHSQRPKRSVRLIVRRTRLTEGAQHQLWPDWRHHAFITNRTDLNCAAADRFHREHATVELATRDLKEGTGLNHTPSGHYAANCAWLACAVLAHNPDTRPPTSPVSHQSQTGPDAPNSPPSPLSPSTGADNQPYGSQLAGPGPTNSTRHSAPCEHFPAPQADTSHQDLTHPRQARRRQPTHDPPTATPTRARTNTPRPTRPTTSIEPKQRPPINKRWIEAQSTSGSPPRSAT